MISRLFSTVFIGLIWFYKIAISPLLGANCRYAPTCSQYGIEAIRTWGPIKGSWMALKRFARCHPWGGHGYDPVPQKNEKEIKGDFFKHK